MKCRSPRIIDNGWFDGQDETDRQYEYGDGVSFRCNSGFDMVGESIIKCSDNGMFEPEPPTCTGKLWLNAYKQLDTRLFLCLS